MNIALNLFPLILIYLFVIFAPICSGEKFLPNKFDMVSRNLIKKYKISYLVSTPSLIDYIDSSKGLNKTNFKFVNKILFCELL